MAEYIEREAPTKYYVVRDKNTGLYFRGKGVNRWGKYYNQASVYRVKANAENAIKEVSWRGEQAEVVEIRIVEAAADVVEVRHGEWKQVDAIFFDHEVLYFKCPLCNTTWESKTNYCPNCGADMRGDKK